MSDLEGNLSYPLFWYNEVTSTMDKARELLGAGSPAAGADMFAVVAEHQMNGRGTRGRDWISAQNNLYLTIALKRSLVNIPITLLPLRIGTIVASCVARRVDNGDEKVKLKWPNDVLIDSKKACGVLIEMDGDMLLIGIGCNVMVAPDVHSSGSGLRPSTCIAAHSAELAEAARNLASKPSVSGAVVGSSGETARAAVEEGLGKLQLSLQEGDYHKMLAVELCNSVDRWMQGQDDRAELVLQDFTRNMDFSPQRLRDLDAATGTVLPLELMPDGTLKVKYVHNGSEATLVAEYLW
ncbi:hypothetical protein B484DRAFT_246971 [Ochromonadaceae sp. CCMP2298]|nr:hypothetical protein B484DRAFT_246971 [Ochromonadaceae sp. CCMP2298]